MLFSIILVVLVHYIFIFNFMTVNFKELSTFSRTSKGVFYDLVLLMLILYFLHKEFYFFVIIMIIDAFFTTILLCIFPVFFVRYAKYENLGFYLIWALIFSVFNPFR